MINFQAKAKTACREINPSVSDGRGTDTNLISFSGQRGNGWGSAGCMIKGELP